ncbi:MAG: FliH/SctL family protein [Candidatus Lustribacter sp.]|jgi:flagellar assembly protein FliH
MGRVVKNARVNSQRYHVSVPLVERQPGDDEQAPFSLNGADPEPLELPSPQSPPIDVDAIAKEARRLIDTAEEKAKALLQDAFERASQLLADAEQRGQAQVATVTAEARAAGHAEASAAVDRDMADMMATMRNLVDMARVERHKLMESAEPELVRLAVGIAERVLHQQIALDRGVVVEMAKVAIARLVEKESVTVRVNPGDLERMREHRDELLDSGEIKNFRVVEDQRVDRGGVVVETDGGTIDARISTQLNEAKRVLHIEDEVIVPAADARESSLRAARAS